MRPFPVESFTLGASPESVKPAIGLYRYIETFFRRYQQPVATKRPSKRQCVSRQIEDSIQSPHLFPGIFTPKQYDTLRCSRLQSFIAGKPDTAAATPAYQIVVFDFCAIHRIETEKPQIPGEFCQMYITYKSRTLIPSDTKSLHVHCHRLQVSRRPVPYRVRQVSLPSARHS